MNLYKAVKESWDIVTSGYDYKRRWGPHVRGCSWLCRECGQSTKDTISLAEEVSHLHDCNIGKAEQFLKETFFDRTQTPSDYLKQVEEMELKDTNNTESP
jgi:hypothetical protein